MKRLLFVLLSISFFSVTLSAGDKGVVVSDAVAKKSGDQVLVSFQVDARDLKSDYKVTLTPVLHSGARSKELSPVSLVGRRRDISDRRTGALAGDRRVVGRTAKAVRYSTAVPFEDWMQSVSVYVDITQEGCCTQEELVREAVTGDMLLFYDVTPHFDRDKLDYELTELEKYDIENPFLHPMEDYHKRYDILLKDLDKNTSKVVFKVGSSVIDMNYHSNSDVLNAVGKAFELIENDPNAILKHIMIAGYASPEGSLALNTRLGLARAEAVKTFLQSRMKTPSDELFELYNGREDWAGLREQVENSDMAEKQEILNIIDGYTIEQEIRKNKLKELNGGAPYRYMLENFYPPLRSGGYVQVYYEIDRRATIATAATDSQGRTTWVNPDSPENRGVTAINKAVDLMAQNNFEEALNVLLEFREDPRAFNNIGVCYMMMKNYDEADRYFQKALANGDGNASKNMKEVETARRIQM